MVTNYETMFGSKPKECATPVVEKDHPESDTSDLIFLMPLVSNSINLSLDLFNG
jgi:hypothetical protein